MTQQIPDLSSDSKIRKGQFRTLAREAMSTNHWNPGDPIARVVSLLEKVYQSGGVDKNRNSESDNEDAPVPWDAIPVRARDILRTIVVYRSYWDAILNQKYDVILYGARKTVPRSERDEASYGLRGAQTWMGLWKREGDQIHLVDRIKLSWPASSASALVKLGIFEEYKIGGKPAAYLTGKGIETFEEAVRQGTIHN